MQYLRCFFVALLTCAIPSAPAAAIAKDAVPRADIVFNTVFLDGPTQWMDAPIVSKVKPRTLRLIPKEEAVFKMISLDCKAVRANGSLDACTVSVEPASNELEKIGQRAARDIRIDPTFSRSIQGKVLKMSIQIRVSNSSVPPWRGPCWPPNCTIVPAPPPPPPPPPPTGG